MIVYNGDIDMENEIVINGVTYVRKDAPPAVKHKFKQGYQYFTYLSSDPDATLKDLKALFPEMNSFFIGKRGYCGMVCLEVAIASMNIGFFKRLLSVSNFNSVIEDEKSFQAMVDKEMSKPDLH